MKILLIKETQTKFKMLDGTSKKVLFEGRAVPEEEVISEMEAASVLAARKVVEANAPVKQEEKPKEDKKPAVKLNPAQRVTAEVESTLEEYWNQIIPGGGKRRSHYSDDYVQGHKMAFHQLVDNRVLNVAILRSTLKLPAQNISKI